MDLLNLSEVDVILISNFYNITALPYITEVCERLSHRINSSTSNLFFSIVDLKDKFMLQNQQKNLGGESYLHWAREHLQLPQTFTWRADNILSKCS